LSGAELAREAPKRRAKSGDLKVVFTGMNREGGGGGGGWGGPFRGGKDKFSRFRKKKKYTPPCGHSGV